MGGVSEQRKGNWYSLEILRLPSQDRWRKRAKVDLEKRLALSGRG